MTGIVELTSGSLQQRALHHLGMFERYRIEVQARESIALAEGRLQQAERVQPGPGPIPDKVMAGFVLRDDRSYALAVAVRDWHQQAFDMYTKAVRLVAG